MAPVASPPSTPVASPPSAPPRVPLRRRGAPLLCLTLAAWWGAACGDASGSATNPFAAPAWQLDPEIRIGAVDDPDYAFGSVRALAPAPDGTILSIHGGEVPLRRWTADGKPAGTLGREGEGPGEFTAPSGMGFFGDTTWVWDRRNYRVSWFGPDGTLLGTTSPRMEMGGGSRSSSPPRPEIPLRGGGFYGRAPAWSQAIAVGDLTSAPHVLMDDAGAILDTTWVQSYRARDVLALLRDGGGTFSAQPFGDQPLVRVEADHRALFVAEQRVPGSGGPAAFTVTRIALEGDTVWHRSFPYEAIPLTDARFDSAVDRQATSLHGFMSQRDDALTLDKVRADLREATYRPDIEPPLRSMVVGRDGSVWLQRARAPEMGVAEWWVLDADGRPEGRVYAPEGTRVLAVDRSYVWGVELDELDVSYIVRYRIARSGP